MWFPGKRPHTASRKQKFFSHQINVGSEPLRKKHQNPFDAVVPHPAEAPHYHGQLNQALEYFHKRLGHSDDFFVRPFKIMGRSSALLFLSTITDNQQLEVLLRSILQHRFPSKRPRNLLHYLTDSVISNSTILYKDNLFELSEDINNGSAVLLIDGEKSALVITVKFIEHRTPDQPYIESTVRGAQVSFVENIDINIGAIRVWMATESLTIKKFKVGYRSRREVAVLYLYDVANPVVVDTILKRIESIHVDVVTQSAEIEQRISDHSWSLLPMTRVTQRIDSTIKELNQGKVLIIVDGDPNALLVPATFQDFFQTEEDYGHIFYEAMFIRYLRVISFFFALFLPALYISFVDFNPELLPKVLGIAIAKSREGVPFPATIEVMMMQVVIEILREATLRMPKQMGQTIGIVGGLVLGEAAVQAELVSNILIIVVALCAMSVFVTPSYEFSVVLRLGSWIMIIAATLFGLYGVVLAAMWGIIELGGMKSFGVSYVDPFGGEHIMDVFIDSFIIRLPVHLMRQRTSHLHPQDGTGAVDVKELPNLHPQVEKSNRQFNDWKRRRRQP
ncbi:spore germination protein [Alicyclobacillus tolerans]|uniref:Spore germination protein n=1 Tax=Alicyclobacillus tolerans TaxID=90970 RepID=A0A1M6R140_9BACL|nr:spore germination protein [Alicyclobacillus montanus]SHK26143.1 spore germination protein [Alicyclobacillus montanus]